MFKQVGDQNYRVAFPMVCRPSPKREREVIIPLGSSCRKGRCSNYFDKSIVLIMILSCQFLWLLVVLKQKQLYKIFVWNITLVSITHQLLSRYPWFSLPSPLPPPFLFCLPNIPGAKMFVLCRPFAPFFQPRNIDVSLLEKKGRLKTSFFRLQQISRKMSMMTI